MGSQCSGPASRAIRSTSSRAVGRIPGASCSAGGEGEQAGEEILLTDADRPTAQTYAAIVLQCVTGWEPSGRFLYDRAAVLALFRPWYGRHAEQIRNRRGKPLVEESLQG